MRSFSGTASTYLATGQVHARILFWASAKNRGTGATETIGIWNGDQDRAFTIGGASRTYVGAGGLIQIEPMVYGTGLQIRTQQVAFSPLDAEVIDLIRTFEPRLAPVELHRALFDPLTGDLIEEPHRIFKGEIDDLTIGTPEVNGTATCSLTLVTTARTLTKTLAAKRSDAVQRQRSSDRFLRYADVSGAVDVFWGEKSAKASSSASKSTPGGGGTSTWNPAKRQDLR